MTATARVARAVAGGVILAAVIALPSAADAQITGGCSATIAGQDVDAAHSARSAIEVSEDDVVTVTGTAPGPITGYEIYMAFGPTRFQVASGDVTDGGNTYTDTVDVGDYARYGVGLYRIEGETIGTPCTGWAYVNVTGPFPLFTVAGAVGGVLTVAGAAGMALSWPRSAKTAVKGTIT